MFSKRYMKYSIVLIVIVLSFLVFKNDVKAVKSTLDSSGIETAFPDSYKPYLRDLARKHPNWKFVAVNTNVHWSQALSEETVDRKSLIPESYPAEWKKSEVEIEPGWVNASNSAVAYALDPRNFLTENGIFQFELTTNDRNIHTDDVIDKVLDGVPMGDASLKTKYKNAGNWINMGKSYGQIIASSAITNNVSGVHLASRIRQETGGDIINNSSINGSYPGYEGWYNFFNIGATTANGDTPIVNALKRARQEGWNTPEKSINAAGKKIYNDYTKWGQNTVYFEKWDVNDPTGGNTLFVYQYMSNILAPSSESNRMYIAYNKANKLESSFTFHIPVFLGMPSEPAKVGDEAKFADDHTKVYLDDPSDIGVNDVFTIRAEPNTNSAIVTKIIETQEGAKNRTKMTRIKKGLNVQWDKIRLDNGLEGYVFSDYVFEYKDYIKVTSLKLNKNSVTIKSGSNEALISTIKPDDAEFKKVNYRSNNESVMTVDANGVITARGLGDATVFATSDDQINIVDTCYVLVKYTDSLDIPIGTPVNIMKEEFKNAKFTTNNENIISVTSNGIITTKNLGDATVFVSDVNGNILSCYYVKASYTDKKYLKVGETSTISIKGAKYYTNNTNVVTVSNSGVITARGLGDATVFVEDTTGKVIAMIYVKNAYTDSKYLKVGENVNIGIQGARYYTNNTDVVTVSNSGVITARGLGDATVFVEDTTGKVIAMIYVKNAYTDSKHLKVGESVSIGIQGAKYYTNNTDVVTVSNSGVITARGLGDATVFVEDTTGKVIAMIYVKNAYTDSKHLKVGESVSIGIQGAKYYTNNTDVVTVSNSGVITARGLGDATVFVEDTTGKVIAMIYVKNAYTDSKYLKVGENVNIGIQGARYYTNNTDVVTVSNSGVITARGLGDATVFAEDISGRIIAMIYVKNSYTDSKNIKVGESVSIGIQGTRYYTNNTEVLEVSNSGVITARNLGDATVFVQDSSGIIAMIYVSTSYTGSKTIYCDDSVNIKEKFELTDSKYNNAKFSINNTNVAKISGDSIRGVAVGECTLFVKNSSNQNLAMFYVSVKEYVEVEKVVVDKTELSLKVGDTYTLNAHVVPDNAKYKELEYSSDNNNAVVVDNKGTIDANFIGVSNVIIKSTDKKTNSKASCNVKVGYNAQIETDIETSKNINDVLDLSKLNVSNITTNNDKVIKVERNGNITPTGIGDASIFIYNTQNKLVALVYVKVIDYVKVSEIRLKVKEINLKVGQKHKLEYEIIPNNAKYKDVDFKSNDDFIAKVDNNGIITSSFLGSANITVITKDKKNIVFNQIRVNCEYTDFIALELNNTINLHNKLGLTENVSNYTFETNNSNVLSLDANSNLTGKSRGDASVFVRDRNGSMVAILYILVK